MRGNPLAASVALLVLLTGCGGAPAATNPDTAGTGSPPTAEPGGSGGTETDLEAAARALFEAFQQDDHQAYFAGLAEACRTGAGFGVVSQFINNRHGSITRAGMDLMRIEVTDVTIADFDGRTATVMLTLSGTQGNPFLEGESNPWVYEAGAWQWANCDPFATTPGGGDVGGSGPDDPIGYGFIGRIAEWYVSSAYILPDGNDLVEEGGNPPPSSGEVYFIWQVSLTYDGPNASAKLGDDLAFRFVAGQTEYMEATACGPHPGALDLDLVVEPGDGQLGDICHAVSTQDADSLFLVVTERATGTDFWFAQE